MGWVLKRYFFSRYIKVTAYFLLGIFILSLLMDFTFNAGRLSGLPGYSAMGALTISILRVPFFLQKLFPFVALFSAMATLMSLNRRNELVITRSIGVSAWQFLAPLAIGAFLLGAFAILFVNPLSAWSSEQAENMIANWRGNNKQVSTFSNYIPWLTQKTDEGTTTIGAKAVLNHGTTLIDAKFVRFNDQERVEEWLNADLATLGENTWILHNVTSNRAGQEPKIIKEMKIATRLRPEYVEERLSAPETIPFYKLPHKIIMARSFGFSTNKFDMQLQSLIALPALLVAMTLIAATVSLKFVRSGQSGMMILAGILCGFVLYVLTELVQAFGNAGSIPPIVAAWAPVIVAFFFSISFLLHKEDG